MPIISTGPDFGNHPTSVTQALSNTPDINLLLTPRLQQILKGIQKSQSVTHPPKVCLPITIEMMESIKRLILQMPKTYTNSMIWAACCRAFFGFLRVSEFTIPSDSQFDEAPHLCLNDISIDSRDNPKNAANKTETIKD